MRLERFTEADLDGAHGLTQALRWPHRREDWAAMLALGRGFVVRDDRGFAGTALWFPCGADHATLGMVIVADDRQGRGIGKALMAAVLEEIADRAILLNATTAGAPLYRALGFAEDGEVAQYQGVFGGIPVAVAGVRGAKPTDWAAMIALDAASFGAERTATIAAVLAAGRAVVIAREGGIAGFAICRPFGRGVVIGPIVAESEADAAAMVGHLGTPGAFVRIDVVGPAPELVDRLIAAGLSCVDRVTPMRRGAWKATGAARRYSLISQARG